MEAGKPCSSHARPRLPWASNSCRFGCRLVYASTFSRSNVIKIAQIQSAPSLPSTGVVELVLAPPAMNFISQQPSFTPQGVSTSWHSSFTYNKQGNDGCDR